MIYFKFAQNKKKIILKRQLLGLIGTTNVYYFVEIWVFALCGLNMKFWICGLQTGTPKKLWICRLLNKFACPCLGDRPQRMVKDE